MEWDIKNDGDKGECSVGPNTTLHNCFVACTKESLSKIKRKKRNYGGSEKRKMGQDTKEGIPSRLVQNKLLISFLSHEIL